MLGRTLRLTTRYAVIAIALFGATNVVTRHLGGLDVNAQWVRGVGFPAWFAEAAILGLVLGLTLGRHGAWLARASGLLLGLLCATDAAAYYQLLADGHIASSFPVPAGLLITALLGIWAVLEPGPDRPASRPSRPWLARAVALGGAVAALVVLHLYCFGATDYRRPADAAVVFGARVHEDGEASGALLDRTVTAVELYRAGLVRKLVLSGGQGPDEPVSESMVMRQIALEEGVPAEALIVDDSGDDTRATIQNLDAIARRHGLSTFLMVSHDYHLSRIQLMCQRRGFDVFTVPARETVPWPSKPLAVLREGAAWIWYYVRDLEVSPASPATRTP